MNLESKVCALEYARKLKELNVKQDGYFSWYAFENPLSQIYKESDVDEDRWRIGITRDCSKGGADWVYSAYTSAELGEMLPPNINDWGLCIDASSCVTDDGIKSMWSIAYADYDKKMFNELSDLNLANAMAKMLIYLIENGLMKNESV